jgi:heme oxygenase
MHNNSNNRALHNNSNNRAIHHNSPHIFSNHNKLLFNSRPLHKDNHLMYSHNIKQQHKIIPQGQAIINRLRLISLLINKMCYNHKTAIKEALQLLNKTPLNRLTQYKHQP